MMKIFDLEAHFYTQSYLEYLSRRKTAPRIDREGDANRVWWNEQLWTPRNAQADEKLLDLGKGRLKNMDEAGITTQVVSLTVPNVQLFEPEEGVAWSKKVNDELSQVVKQYPERIIGLATIAPQSPLEAADELERAVTKLGLKGVNIEGHARNEYLDDKK